MNDLFVALGLVLVLEGALYALGPGLVKRMAMMAIDVEESQLRVAGLVAVVAGVAIVWLVRSL